MNFSKMPISGFFRTLGSSSPSPGGGSAAALAGAAGIALLEMVIRINANRARKKYKISSIERLRLKMERLITLDAEVFMKISKYFKKKGGKKNLQRALKEGAGVPLEICEVSVQALQIGILQKNRTSRWLSSDLAEAGVLLEAAFKSAQFNVDVNLRNITDKNFVSKVSTRLGLLEKKVSKHRNQLLGILPR